MTESIVVNAISKSFKISKKQQKIDRTSENVKRALVDVSFNTYKGEIFGLLGPNGAGKTTALRCIATLMSPDKGNIIVNGIDTKNDLKVRRNLSFLTNELKLDDMFTPNYLFDYFAKLYELSDELRDERKKELFEIFGVDKFAEVKMCELSTGMKQKASIVMSLVHDPDIVIFDEPTNGLDILTAKVVTDYLLSLKEKGKTVIISTHIMELVNKICDRVGIIINGKLVLCDTLANVCKEKSLDDVFFDLYKQEAGEK